MMDDSNFPDALSILRFNAERKQQGTRQSCEVIEGKLTLRAILGGVSIFYVIFI